MQVVYDAALHAGDEAELVAAHPVIGRFVSFRNKNAKVGAKVGRSIAVETIEVELLGVEVGAVEEELAVGDEGLEVAIAAQERRAARVGRGLDIHLVVIRGIARAVAIIEDVYTSTILETEVAVPPHYGQGTKVPTGLDNLFLAVLGEEPEGGCTEQHDG